MFAADVDENARYPQEAADALLAADFHAPHVPEEYGGAGADALMTVIVMEVGGVRGGVEPAGSRRSTSSAGWSSWPVVRRSEEALSRPAAGEGGFSYCLSSTDAGSDAAGMKTRAVRDGDHSVSDGQIGTRWIAERGVSEYYTVMARDRPPTSGPRGISAFVVEKSDEGVTFGAPEREAGDQGVPDACQV